MRFAADPDGAQLSRLDAGARERVTRRLDAHRHRVFVQTRHGFLFDGQTILCAAPHARNLFRANAIARHIRTVTDNANVTFGFHYTHCKLRIAYCVSLITHHVSRFTFLLLNTSSQFTFAVTCIITASVMMAPMVMTSPV
jgi:hypothetical protein